MGKRGDAPGVEIHGKRLRIVFHWNGRRYREVLDLPPTSANRRYAANLRAEIVGRIERGTFNYDEYFDDRRGGPELAQEEGGTFGEIASRWLTAQKSELAHSTWRMYKSNLDAHWLPSLGDKRLDALTALGVQEIVGAIRWESRKTRNNALVPLRQVLETAFDEGLCKVPIAAKLKGLKVQADPPDPLEREEMEAVLAVMRKRYAEPTVNLFEFGFLSAVRTPSELIALAWSDFDERRGSVLVRRARVYGRDKGTKTSRMREVELEPRALDVLARQKKHSRLAGAEIFVNPDTGKPFHSVRADLVIGKWWYSALDRAQVRRRTPYHMRHTWATLALTTGCDLSWVSKQLGHSSPQTTMKEYARWITGADQGRNIRKLGEALATVGGKREAQK